MKQEVILKTEKISLMSAESKRVETQVQEQTEQGSLGKKTYSAGFLKTVSSLYTRWMNTVYLSEYKGSWGNRFQEPHSLILQLF